MASTNKIRLCQNAAQHGTIRWVMCLARHYLDARGNKAQRARIKSVMEKLSPELRADIGFGNEHVTRCDQ